MLPYLASRCLTLLCLKALIVSNCPELSNLHFPCHCLVLPCPRPPLLCHLASFFLPCLFCHSLPILVLFFRLQSVVRRSETNKTRRWRNCLALSILSCLLPFACPSPLLSCLLFIFLALSCFVLPCFPLLFLLPYFLVYCLYFLLVLPCLVLSCFRFACPRPLLSCLSFICLAFSCHNLSCFTVFHFAFLCPLMFCLLSVFLVLSCPLCLALLYLVPSCPSLSSFKKNLKTHVFKERFSFGL